MKLHFKSVVNPRITEMMRVLSTTLIRVFVQRTLHVPDETYEEKLQFLKKRIWHIVLAKNHS